MTALAGRIALLGWLAVVLLQARAAAQKPPGLGYVYPPAIVAGQEAHVQLGGFDFTADMQWFVHDEAVELQPLGPPGDYQLPPPPYWFGPRASTPALPIPREVPARIAAGPSGPQRLVRWQVANANGASGTAVFFVSRGREITELRSRDFPQRLPELPVAVSGRLSRLTETDRYELLAEADGLVSVELFARRLGADFHAVLEVRDEQGALLAELADTLGFDGSVAFLARAGRKYLISLHDADFRGDRAYVYRLAFSPGPRVVCLLPAFGQRGATQEIEFVGNGVLTGQPGLETARRTLTFPANEALADQPYRLDTPAGAVDLTVPLSRFVQHVREAGAQSTTAGPPDENGLMMLTAPCAVTGRIARDQSGQRFGWMVRKGEFWSVALESRAIGGTLDMALTVLDPDGKPVGEVDDLPDTTDASLDFQAAADGLYTCVATALSETNGRPDEVYCLRVVPQPRDFALTMPQQLALPLGGKAELTVHAVRFGGFDGEIVLDVAGLPAGVSVSGEAKIPSGKNEARLAVQSAADAAVVAALLTVNGTAMIDGRAIARQAQAPASGNLCPRGVAQSRVPRLLLAMTMPAPFEVRVVDRERQRDVHRGTTYLAELEIVRQPGFAEEIRLEMSAQQDRYRQGTTGPIISVPPNESRAFYPCFLPEWLGTDLTRRIVVHGVAGVPDPRGNVRQLSRAGDARITMIMEGALLKLSTRARSGSRVLGQSFDLPVTVSRSARLPLPVTVTLEPPEEAAPLLTAEPIVLPPGTDQGVLQVSPKADERLLGPWLLRMKATALQEGKWPVVSETELEVEFTAP